MIDLSNIAKNSSVILYYPLINDDYYSTMPSKGDIPLQWLVGNDVANIMTKRFSPLQLVRFSYGDTYVIARQRMNDIKVIISHNLSQQEK